MKQTLHYGKLIMVNLAKVILLVAFHIGLVITTVWLAIVELVKLIFAIIVEYFNQLEAFNTEVMQFINTQIFKEKA